MDSEDTRDLKKWAIEQAIGHQPRGEDSANVVKDAMDYEAFVRGGAPVKEDAPGD